MTLMERARMDLRMSRDALHAQTGVPLRTIRELESGRVKTPKLDTLAPIADALDLSVSSLAEDFRRDLSPAA